MWKSPAGNMIAQVFTGHSTNWWENKYHDFKDKCSDFKVWWKEKGNDIHNYWDDHKWFRITAYVLITVAVIAAAAFAGPVLFTVAGVPITWAITGAIAGAIIGGVYGGTNGFNGGWNWENAAKGMMKGAIIGAVAGYCIGNATSLTATNFNNSVTFAYNNPCSYTLTGINGVNTVSLFNMGYAYYSMYSTPTMVEQLVNHRSFDVMGYGYDFDDTEVLTR